VSISLRVSTKGLADLVQAFAVEPLLAHALMNSEALGREFTVADS
jgi:hypothetical protein